MVNLVPDLLWRNDPDGTATWYNQQWYDYTGQTPAEAEDEGWLNALHPEDREPSRQNYQEAMAAGEPLRHEQRIQRHDGKYRWFLARARPVTDDDGEITGWFGASTDVHDERVATAALERLNAATRELIDADTTTISERAAPLTRDVLGVEYATLWRYDEQTGDLEATATHTAEGIDADAVRLPDGFADRVWQTFVCGDSDVDNDLAVETNGTALRSVAIVPLGRHGVVCAGSTRTDAFDDRLVDLAETVGTTVVSAWDRAAGERALATQNEELERLDRLNRLIREIDLALVEADTAEVVQAAVCERLASSDRFAFAWIGEYDAATGTVEPQEWAGVDSTYLEHLDVAVDDAGTHPDPIATAVRTGEMQVVDDIVTDARVADWREATLERGARSCLSIPLLYDDSRYGVLTVYADRPRTDERDHDVLAELGRTVAHAINAIETRATHGTETAVELTVRATVDSPLCRLARETDCVLAVEGLVPGENGETTVFLTVADSESEAFRTAAEDRLAVAALTRLGERPDGVSFRATVSEPVVPSELVGAGGQLRTCTIDAGTATAVVDLPQTADVRAFVDRARQFAPDLELLARRTRTQAMETPHTLQTALDERLTHRQREVLQLAFHSGFFESPRARTGAELAAALDISQSTFTYHLRGAERNLCGLVFDHR